jgi:hypothetical protein
MDNIGPTECVIIFFILGIWIAPSIAAALIAKNKGRSAWGLFFLSILLSPVVGIIVALVLPPDTAALEKKQLESGEYRRCPFCSELVRSTASVCKHCGRDLAPNAPPSSAANANG